MKLPFSRIYAKFDFRITGNCIWVEKTMKDLGKRFSYYVYHKTDHGFFDETSTQYDSEAAKLAWTRTLQFLHAFS